jgi:6,7-dimethyl-8-ribityllumazine synthase
MSFVTDDYTKQTQPPRTEWRIAIVQARFNSEITNLLKDACVNRLKELGYKNNQVVVIDVAGSFEIPLIAQSMLQTGCDGVVAIGAIIRGETTHYELICESVQQALTQLQLKESKPVVFGLLTTENMQQALDRANGRHSDTGRNCADILNENLHHLHKIKNEGGYF